MRMYPLLGALFLLTTMIIQGCGSVPAAEVATATAQTPDLPAATEAAPTLVVTATTSGATEPAATAPSAGGTLAWRDQVLYNDAVVVATSGLPEPPAGQVYAVWLASAERRLPLGPLRLDSDGSATLTYTAPDQANLLGNYARVLVTLVPREQATSAVDAVVMSGALPARTLIPIRQVLVSTDRTPGNIGFVAGLRQETAELLRHAQFLQEAFEAGDVPLQRTHAEHIINIIRGSEARDVNGDGKVQNPGDGFGLLPNGRQDGYIKGVSDHAQQAAAAIDATEAVILHAGHVQIVAENTRQRVEEMRSLAERIAASGYLDDTRQDVLSLVALAQQTIQGVDLDLDEQIEPVAGEGGVITAYQHAQLMAGVPLTPEPVALPAPSTAPVVDAPAPVDEVVIDVGDNRFAPGKITVPRGATVIWTHAGQRSHTVTADDGTFDSGTLAPGDSFRFTFEQAGTFLYHCAFHGGPDGEGMAGAIVVTDGSAAPVLAPAPAAPAPGSPTVPPAATRVPATPALTDRVEEAETAEPEIIEGDATVTMTDFAFEPKLIRVRAGTTITWRNDGQRTHSATGVDGTFDTGLFDTGESRSVTFDQPGTFAYFCQIHGTPDGRRAMVGTVIVEP